MRDLVARLAPHETRALDEAFKFLGRGASDDDLSLLFDRAGIVKPPHVRALIKVYRWRHEDDGAPGLRQHRPE